ncbi:MAG: FtsX-like permease family protein [Nevskia sp.]|nr:FtsX-like permease family protein [Nevskia sp.]
MRNLLLALRNLLRNRRRTLSTLLAIVVGTQSILLFGGYSRGIIYGTQTEFVKRSGHLQIQRKGYYLYGGGNPAAYGISDYQQIIDAVQHDPVLAPMLTVVTPTLQLGGIAGNFAAGVSRTVIGTGIDVDDQNKLQAWNDYGFPAINNGKPLSLTGTAPDAAVVGMGVARVLHLCRKLKVPDCKQEAPPDPAPPPESANAAAAPADISDLARGEPGEPAANDSAARIEVLAADTHGAPNVVSLSVVEAGNQGIKELDDVFLMMHLEEAQRLIYGRSAPQVTGIVVQLQHTGQIAPARARLRELLAASFPGQELDVLDFATINPTYGQFISFFNAIFGFIAILMGVIVLFTVSNTMNTSIVERTVEIGTLRAIGMRRRGIQMLFIYEGLVLGILGVVLGVMITLLLAAVVNHSGLSYVPPGRVDQVLYFIWLSGKQNLLFILGIAATLILLVMGSAWWPAHRAAKMEIVNALRHV